jgi:hypothetical protein
MRAGCRRSWPRTLADQPSGDGLVYAFGVSRFRPRAEGDGLVQGKASGDEKDLPRAVRERVVHTPAEARDTRRLAAQSRLGDGR